MFGKWTWQVKYPLAIMFILSLILTSASFSVLLYKKMTDQESKLGFNSVIETQEQNNLIKPTPNENIVEIKRVMTKSAMIDAPLIKQKPELYSGCELTALTMLLQFYGVKKDKMALLPEMKKDPTQLKLGKDGSIQYWGDPNIGFVGDITGKQRGYGIYHAPLFILLKKYIPSGQDLTGESFEAIEQKLYEGIPVIVWTTVSFTVPSNEQWVVWDSPNGLVKATFKEHSVLLVGYDEEHVYVNDPLSGLKKFKVEKQQFIASWEAMGKQALSYEFK